MLLRISVWMNPESESEVILMVLNRGAKGYPNRFRNDRKKVYKQTHRQTDIFVFI